MKMRKIVIVSIGTASILAISGLIFPDARTLVAGGNLTLTNGGVWGDAWHGGSYSADQTVVYVPIWRQTNDRGGSNLEYEVTGVAAFVLTGYDRHSVTVSGNFVEFYSYPSVPAGFGAPPCTTTTDPTCNERTNFIGLVN